jgi:hypothetical protein|tara:strand:- start:50 stop:733 length:684 start_codon:yes stop_codon:yes gene_type:complete
MFKVYKIIILSIFIFIPSALNAHLQHYDDLNRIEFDIYRNKKHIGKHIFSFNRSDDQLAVESEINFEIKKFGVVLYKYYVRGTEIYKDGELIKFNSKTNQNGKKKYVNIKLENGEYTIDGSSYKGKVPKEYLIGTWWNHSIVKAAAQISAVSGRIIKQKVTFLGKETIKLDGKIYNTLHFNFSSTDKKLNKNKRLNTHVWYDEKTLNWVKASFEKKGKWEYKLVSID